MIKNANNKLFKHHLPQCLVVGVVFLLAISFIPQSQGGGLGWGYGVGDDPPPLPPGYTPWPLLGQLTGFQVPTRIALSSTGNVYVTDNQKGIVAIYDATGKGIGVIRDLTAPLGLAIFEPSSQPPPGPPDYCTSGVKLTREQKDECKWWEKNPPEAPVEVPSSPSPVIYVGDDSNGSVRVFNHDSISELGSGNGEFLRPNGIAVTAEQAVYVVDSKANQVKVYDGAGVFQFTFGSQGSGDGQFNYPIDIVVNETLSELYITDFWNERIVVFDLSGSWQRNIATPLNDGGDPAYFRPSGLGIDYAGNLYVVDNSLSCVVIIDNLGGLIDIIGYYSGQYWTGDLELPLDAAADNERIYVTSGQERVIKIFEGVAP